MSVRMNVTGKASCPAENGHSLPNTVTEVTLPPMRSPTTRHVMKIATSVTNSVIRASSFTHVTLSQVGSSPLVGRTTSGSRTNRTTAHEDPRAYRGTCLDGASRGGLYVSREEEQEHRRGDPRHPQAIRLGLDHAARRQRGRRGRSDPDGLGRARRRA